MNPGRLPVANTRGHSPWLQTLLCGLARPVSGLRLLALAYSGAGCCGSCSRQLLLRLLAPRRSEGLQARSVYSTRSRPHSERFVHGLPQLVTPGQALGGFFAHEFAVQPAHRWLQRTDGRWEERCRVLGFITILGLHNRGLTALCESVVASTRGAALSRACLKRPRARSHARIQRCTVSDVASRTLPHCGDKTAANYIAIC